MRFAYAVLALFRPLVRQVVFRHWWRAVVVMLSLAIPLGWVSYFVTTEHIEAKTTTAGSAPTTMIWRGPMRCAQNGDGQTVACPVDSSSEESSSARTQDPSPYFLPKNQWKRTSLDEYVADSLPTGFSAYRRYQGTAKLAATRPDGGILRATVIGIDPERIPARFPQGLSDSTIFLGHATAASLGVGKGDEITISQPKTVQGRQQDSITTLTVAEITPGEESWVTNTVLLGEDPTVEQVSRLVMSPVWTLESPQEITWRDVQRLNARGFIVTSRNLTENPPPAEELRPEIREMASSRSEITADAFWVVVAVWAIRLLVVLVLGCVLSPVFIIMFYRHLDLFAQLSAQGATPRQLRVATGLMGGIVGGLGSLLGVIAGWAIAAIQHLWFFPGWPIFANFSAFLTIALVTVPVCIALAWFPALLTARLPMRATLIGPETNRTSGWQRWMAIGPVGLVATLGVIAVIRLADLPIPVALRGLVGPDSLIGLLLEIFAGLSAPALVVGTAALLRQGPITARIAGRRMARSVVQSSSVVLAVFPIAIWVVVFFTGSTFYFNRAAGAEDLTTTSHIAVVSANRDAFASDSSMKEELAATAKEVAKALEVPEEEIISLDGVLLSRFHKSDTSGTSIAVDRDAGQNLSQRCDLGAVAPREVRQRFEQATSQGKRAAEDPEAARACLPAISAIGMSPALQRVESNAFNANDDSLRLWKFQTPEDEKLARATIKAGGVLVPIGTPTPNGKVTLTASEDRRVFGRLEESTPRSKEFPAAAVLPWTATPTIILSTEVRREFNLQLGTHAFVIPLDGPVDIRRERAVTAALDAANQPNPNRFSYIAPAQPRYRAYSVSILMFCCSLGLLTLLALLSARTARRDNATLRALGATPRQCFSVAATQMGATVGVAFIAAHLVGTALVATTVTFDITAPGGYLLQYGSYRVFSPHWGVLVGLLLGTVGGALVAGWLARSGPWILRSTRQ